MICQYFINYDEVDVYTEQGAMFKISVEDLDLIESYNWYLDGNYLKASKKPYVNKKLHRIIAERMNLDMNLQVDHINADKLDNRRENLRTATVQQNGQNRGKYSCNTSGFKGVSWDKRDNKWFSQINVNGKRIFLGRFETPELAAKAYNDAAIKYHGEFAKLNEV